MKQLWILNHYVQEPGRPGGTRHFSLAKYLPEAGWKASLVGASTELNTGRQRLAEHEQWRLDLVEEIPFLWVKTPGYRGNGAGRMKNMLAYTWQVLRLPLESQLPRPDAIIGSSVHPFAAFAGWRLSRRYGVPFIFEVRDLWPQTLIDLGRLRPNSPAAIAMRALERFLYNRAHRVITLLPAAADYICPMGIAREKIEWLPNGIDISAVPEPEVQREGPEFVLMYLGSFGNANGIDQLLDGMRVLSGRRLSKPVRLRLIGEGPLKPHYQQQAEALGLSGQVSFEPAVPKSDVARMASQADAFAVCLSDIPLYRFGISLNKLSDYMAAGRPVIFAGKTANDPIADAKAGISIEPANPAQFADAVQKLMEMSVEERTAMGHRGREHVQAFYDYRKLSTRLGKMLDVITEDAR